MKQSSLHRLRNTTAALFFAAALVTTAAPALADDGGDSDAPTSAATVETPPADNATETEPQPAEEAPEQVASEDADTAGADAPESGAESPATIPGIQNPVATFARQIAAAGQAVPGSYVVDTLAVADDDNIGDGVCETAANECSLKAALQEANAQTAGDATITFSVTGVIPSTGGAQRMHTGDLGVWASVIGNGAQYLIDSAVPVTIDFDGLGGVKQQDDYNAAMFYVASDHVVLKNAADIRSGAGGVAISGQNVTIENSNISDEDTNWQETSVGLLDGASNVVVRNSNLTSGYFHALLVDDGATVSNVTLDGVTSRGHGEAHINIEGNATVNGFVVTNSRFGKPIADGPEASPSHGIFIEENVNITGLQVRNSDFTSFNKHGIFQAGGGTTLTNTVIEDNTFASNYRGINLESDTTVNSLVVRNNSFDDNLDHAIYMGAISEDSTDLDIRNNKFTDGRANAETTVWLPTRPITNGVLAGNTFTQSTQALANRWAIWQNSAAGDGVSTGWTIVGNHIDGYGVGAWNGGADGSEGPIVMHGAGKSVIAQNTFGPKVQGNDDNRSEYANAYFLVNWDSFNNRIQTWRPSDAQFSDTKLKLTVAPVDPGENGLTNQPTGPVDLDVYWSEGFAAEKYVGTIEGVSSATTTTLDWSGGAGYIRIQTHDADGRSSQYSAPAKTEKAAIPVVPVVTDQVLRGELKGTGQPGASIQVLGPNGEVVCDTEVNSDGLWDCGDGVVLTCGTEYTVVQTDALGQENESTFTTADCDLDENEGADDEGVDNEGAEDDAELPDTGAPSNVSWALGMAACLIAFGSLMVRRRRRLS